MRLAIFVSLALAAGVTSFGASACERWDEYTGKIAKAQGDYHPRVASGARESGIVSIIGRTPDSALNPRVSCESIEVPEEWPTTLRLAPISWSGETSIGSATTPTTISRPPTASPSITRV